MNLTNGKVKSATRELKRHRLSYIFPNLQSPRMLNRMRTTKADLNLADQN